MSDRHQLTDPDARSQGSDVEPGAPAEEKAPRRRRGRRIALIVLLVAVLLTGGTAVAGGLYYRSVDKSIERVDAFEGVPEESRPQVEAKGAMNIMILGSDSRDPESTGGSRSDTIILAHLPKDRRAHSSSRSPGTPGRPSPSRRRAAAAATRRSTPRTPGAACH